MLLETRVIHRTGLRISSPGFGCWGISSGFGGSLSPQEVKLVLDCAWHHGVTFFDTAPVYGDGAGESIFGELSWRHDAIIATKISLASRPPHPVGPAEEYYPRKFILSSVDQSLKRLRRDHIDVIQLHTWFEDWEGDPGAVFGVLQELKKEGKVRAIGVSLPGTERCTIQGLLKWGVVDTIQVPYNILQQWARPLVLEAASSRVAVIARSPLCHGLLAGDISRFHHMHEGDPRMLKMTSGRLAQIFEWRKELSERIGIQPQDFASYAIAFVQNTPGVTSVVVGMRTIDHVHQNLTERLCSAN